MIGDLYWTGKLAPVKSGESTYTVFDLNDLRIAEMFAIQAAIAIENAQLYRKTQQLAVLQERQRFGMDLHDGRGLVLSQAKDKGGNGLRNMQERAAALGGDMQVESAPGRGARLEIRVPLQANGLT